jgi:hypothetical protein
MLEDDNTDITVGEFVEMLWTECCGGCDTGCGVDSECRAGTECGGAAPGEGSAASLTLSELLRYGHFRGWLEDSDERHPETLLNRQTAARIIHQFMVVELHVPDIADISAAEKLRDLYTCRVCANHIAQVYARGIMGAEEVLPGDAAATQSILIFNHLGRMSYREVQKIISSIKKAML